ncbi:hypothetical protein [Nocardioides piscis]|uniref:Uncharacterized protein n=1 Tax=Nocardioides piscis TaxID=2714938 RepID=A0A6G7YD87_9ACTN|nr:hypothetical protein [Nocardioides piscis]QIK74689.1 hypothetical protein G7071_03895 [Nocardioides piscis]
MTSAADALAELHRALEAPRDGVVSTGSWRWNVRQRMTRVRDLLIRESEHPDEAWLSARRGSALRERQALLARMGALGPEVLENPDLEQVREHGLRLLSDIDHHLQRLRDLAYDDVALELGGSE